MQVAIVMTSTGQQWDDTTVFIDKSTITGCYLIRQSRILQWSGLWTIIVAIVFITL